MALKSGVLWNFTQGSDMVSSVSDYPGNDVLITLGGEGPTGKPVRALLPWSR